MDRDLLLIIYRLLNRNIFWDTYRQTRTTMSKTPTLDVSNINPNVVAAEYAVRGAIAVKAQQHGEKLRNGEDLGFESLVQCNIGALVSTSTQACATLWSSHLICVGNPQILEQKPISFFRQVLAICDYPEVGSGSGVLRNVKWALSHICACSS